jgi:hypothetical protein
MRDLIRGISRYPFRFILFYWVCFTFPFPIDLAAIPFSFVEPKNQPGWMIATAEKYTAVYSWIQKTKDDACVWVGDRVLQVEAIIQPTGSGDTMRAYVGCLFAVAIAAALALLWTGIVFLVERRKPEWNWDASLFSLLRVLARFFLCEMLLGYGFAKVFPLQFAQPGAYRLTQQLGEMSPMGLLWTFMGFSPAYQMFTGAVEVLAGLLLTTRRTTLLGSLVALAAMTQIFMLNMCFDVPVKLYSFNYLVMAVFLLAPGLSRLVDSLILGRAVAALALPALFGSVKIDRLVLVLQTLVVVMMIASQIHGSYKRWNDMYGGAPAPVLGRWELVLIEVDKVKPAEDDPMNWSWLEFSNRQIMRLSTRKPPAVAYLITWDAESKKLTLKKVRSPTSTATFSYDVPEPDKLVLEGSMDGKSVRATLKRAAEKRYELTSRGFNWIQEMPFNR